jgi:hypothetical protein
MTDENAGGHTPTTSQPPAWRFENTKDNAIAWPSQGAMSRYERMGYETADFYEHFPCFVGAKLIGRFISLYESYKQTLGLAGHIAEVGVYRGACSFFFAKLAVLYEPNAMTQVHGFDLFERAEYPSDAGKGYSFQETYQRVLDLVEVQGLQGYLKLHQLDARTDLPDFFRQNSHLQFKLVLLDSGAEYSIVKSSIEAFWPRLAYGGIMIFDQYNHEVAPEETRAVVDCLPCGTVIRTFPNGWMPTAYVVKEPPRSFLGFRRFLQVLKLPSQPKPPRQ